MTPADQSSQKWFLAFVLCLLAFSNVFHPVVKDPTKLLMENLPYDLYPRGVLTKNGTLEAALPEDDSSSIDPLPNDEMETLDNTTLTSAFYTNNNNDNTTIKTTTANAWDHLVMRYRRHPDAVPLEPIPVMLWPYQDKGFSADSADMVHIETNGVLESSMLYLAPKGVLTLDHPNVVWLTDVKFPSGEWCKRLVAKAKKTVERRKARGMPLQWPIFVVDFTDQRTYYRCKGLEAIVGQEFVIYSKRSVVVDRVWNKNWVSLGKKVLEKDNVTYERMPLIVRTDIVETLNDVLQSRGIKLSDAIEKVERSVDIAHYWPSDGKSGIGRFQRELRTKVSRTLDDQLSSKYKVFCGVTGTADRQGRRKPQLSYIEHMLNTKIVVVTQRDEWEGHYRLYEALVSGAMVMSDQMLILPRLGLENGTSIIEFDSAKRLVSLAEYYLQHEEQRQAIAAKGRHVAMSQHRSWHRMEEIVFGRIVTPCTATECPYIVHANESNAQRVV